MSPEDYNEDNYHKDSDTWCLPRMMMGIVIIRIVIVICDVCWGWSVIIMTVWRDTRCLLRMIMAITDHNDDDTGGDDHSNNDLHRHHPAYQMRWCLLVVTMLTSPMILIISSLSIYLYTVTGSHLVFLRHKLVKSCAEPRIWSYSTSLSLSTLPLIYFHLK